jgi:hypothetical protein
MSLTFAYSIIDLSLPWGIVAKDITAEGSSLILLYLVSLFLFYMKLRLMPVFVLLVLVGSCKNRLEKHGELFSDLMKSPDGLFRGIHMGDSPDLVQQTETGSITSIDSTAISYEVHVGGSGTCTITYGFENQGVYEIITEATFEHTKDGLDLLTGFREYFNELYGPYEKERGNLVWKVKGKGPDSGTILEMTDESEFTDFGLWSLSIYKPGSAAIEAEGLMIN